MSAARSRGTYLSAKYRRIAARRGPLKAIVAVEHAIDPDKAKYGAIDQLRSLGYAVTLKPLAAVG